ncbi:MAG TPA: 3-phosphoshikimate 1-carboxyvinyltransferase [Solirubrobacteraceae bacterium]|nr:3-phosphoshikimate 1-carboxyvinyltransferase [Solirubrobacteraceae bacterium]
MNARFEPASRLRGRLTPPPDKSISHRAALVGAMASDPVCIRNYLHAADTESTLHAIGTLGAIVERRHSELVIRGGGLRNVQPPTLPIYVGNAGTLMRLLPGWLSFQRGHAFTLDGDESIRRRPVDRIAEPLHLMGATIEAREGRYPPFTVHGASLDGIVYELPVASAQVKSCVLLAGLTTDMTTVVEPNPTRDHTERLLARSGASIERQTLAGGQLQTTIRNADELELEVIDVPGDLSSAAFLITAGVLVAGSRLVLENVGVNWTRSGFLRIVGRMGAVVITDAEPDGTFSEQEPAAEIDISHGPLEGVEVGPEEVPLAIDELPLIALLGCFAEGETIVRGAQELRIKESDRIAAVVEGLRGLGADIEDAPDGFAVRGTGGLAGGRLQTYGDHRLALLGAVAGLASKDGVEVVDMEAATVSYPGFAEDLATLMP